MSLRRRGGADSTPASPHAPCPPKKKEDAQEEVGAARFGRVRNNLKMGIVGLPNVGKSSLFNLLTSQSIAAENFPFCTIEPNEARCAVPDDRYDYLCDIWKPPPCIPPISTSPTSPVSSAAPPRAPVSATLSCPTSRRWMEIFPRGRARLTARR